jgi:uncharacterized protein (TIGR00369 family)
MTRPPDPPETGPAAVVTAIAVAMDQVPFAGWLGLELTGVEDDRVFIRFDMRPEFVGNPARNILHGGIISAVLDTVGGFAALLGVLSRNPNESAAEIAPWLGTVDMRTDFLRPGSGDEFTACAYPLRVGKRLVVTRMELHGPSGDTIAVGTGTYVAP